MALNFSSTARGVRRGGGRIDGIRFAIIDFPDPGRPMQKML
jgi:hypothetical protein